ncbi:MAG: hypothetical protein AAF226_04420 [Verrucomicrobiota bacterium]
MQGHWIGKPGEEMVDLIEDLIEKCPSADGNRIYLTGSSMGGNGVVLHFAEHQKMYAAGISLCQGIPYQDRFEFRRDAPVWMFHGDNDTVIDVKASRSWVDPMRRNENFKYTELKGEGHGIQRSVAENDAALEWMFSFRLEDE